jgi:hypothetical protein
MILEKPITPALVTTTPGLAYYTADAALMRAIIKKLTFHNSDTVTRTVVVNLVPSGGAATVTNQLTAIKSLLPDETWECYEAINQTLLGGGMIWAIASVASKINILGTVMEHS